MAKETIYKYMIGLGILLTVVSIIFSDFIISFSLYLFVFGCFLILGGAFLWFFYSQRKKKEEYTKDEMLKLIGK